MLATARDEQRFLVAVHHENQQRLLEGRCPPELGAIRSSSRLVLGGQRQGLGSVLQFLASFRK